jgi:hypothetical protein
MRRRVDYEWVCEVEDEHGDIIDCRFADDREGAERQREPGSKCSIALVKHEYDEIDGELGRGYAYLDEQGNLPEQFEGDVDPTIPKRFR